MKQIQNGLTETKYTKVYHEEDFKFNAPHHFDVTTMKDRLDGKEGKLEVAITRIDFQEGPIKEVGVNGVTNEDLLAMVLTRLEHFQESDFRCRENAIAITKIEESLLWLKKRTLDRETRNVEGTHIK
jgi:hypothetical protein